MPYSLFHEHNKDVHPAEKKIELGYLMPLDKFFEQSYWGFCDSPVPENIFYPFHVTSFIEGGNYWCVLATVTEKPEDSVVIKFCSDDFYHYGVKKLPQALFTMCQFVDAVYPKHARLLQESVLSDYAICYFINVAETDCNATNTDAVIAIYERMLASEKGANHE